MSETIEQRLRGYGKTDGTCLVFPSDVVELLDERDAELSKLRAELSTKDEIITGAFLALDNYGALLAAANRISDDLQTEYYAKDAEIARLRDALEQYADEKNWQKIDFRLARETLKGGNQ